MITFIGALLLFWGLFDIVCGGAQITLGLIYWIAGFFDKDLK